MLRNILQAEEEYGSIEECELYMIQYKRTCLGPDSLRSCIDYRILLGNSLRSISLTVATSWFDLAHRTYLLERFSAFDIF
jgi:hypothetical protein